MIRLALVPIFALAFVLSVGGVARAENEEEQTADPGSELFRQALSDYRTALAELRELCTAGDDDAGVSTARRRAPKEMTACQRGMKELKSFLVEVRKTAHWVSQKHAEDKEARRVAKEVAKEEERQAKERDERDAEERKDSERKAAEDSSRAAEKAKRDEAARQAEKAKQAQKSAEKSKEQQKVSDTSKQRSSYERELAEMRKKLQAELNDWAQGERAANELQLLAATKTGEERAKHEQKAVTEKKHAAEHQAMAQKLLAKIAEYEKSLTALPKQVAQDLAKKAQKLRDQIRSLEGTAAYKRGLEQDAIDRANEYRAIANEKDGAEREKYLYKAAEMDRQADEWARYASDYEEQRDRAQAELDALGL